MRTMFVMVQRALTSEPVSVGAYFVVAVQDRVLAGFLAVHFGVIVSLSSSTQCKTSSTKSNVHAAAATTLVTSVVSPNHVPTLTAQHSQSAKLCTHFTQM